MADYDWDFTDYKLEARKRRVRSELEAEFLEIGYEIETEAVGYGSNLRARPVGNAVCTRCGCVVALRLTGRHDEHFHPYPRG